MKTCPKCSSSLEDHVAFCPFCGQDVQHLEVQEAADPNLGKVLSGNFRIEEPIGVGAMGTVYRATQLSLNKPVAIKILHRRLMGDPHLEKRFHREARASSRLSHPNSIQVIDYGKAEDGSLYIAMEYLEGRDLGQIIKDEHPLAWSRICNLLAQVCSALDEAHASGIIHRDLKPENILVLERRGGGELVKVLDFGIAKIQDAQREDGEAPLTFAGMVCGTPEYMSPEQARGAEITARSDLYSVGAILYQMITGAVVFEGTTTLAIVTKQLSEDPVPPSERAPDLEIPPALEQLCLRTLAKDEQQRPASARELMDTLLAIHAELEGGAPAGLFGVTPIPETLSTPPRPEVQGDADDVFTSASPDAEAAPARGPSTEAEIACAGTADEQPALTVPLPPDVLEAVAGPPLEEGEGESAAADAAATPADGAGQGARAKKGGWALVLGVALGVALLGTGVAVYLLLGDALLGRDKPTLGTVTVTKGKLPASQRAGADKAGVDAGAAQERAVDAAAKEGDEQERAAVGATTGDGEPGDGAGLGGRDESRAATPNDDDEPARASQPDRPARHRTASARGSGRGKVKRPEPRPRQPSGEDFMKEGLALFRKGRVKEAIKSYSKALKVGHRDPELYYELGRCYARIRNSERSDHFYRLYVRHGRDKRKREMVNAILSASR